MYQVVQLYKHRLLANLRLSWQQIGQFSNFSNYCLHHKTIKRWLWCLIWDVLSPLVRFCFLFFVFLAFDFWRFCVVNCFFHPRHNSQWPPTSKDFFTRSYPLHYFHILILEKEPVFPFSMLSAKQGNYWYHVITSLVWRGLWLGIKPGTFRTLCQQSTTRLSRRRC